MYALRVGCVAALSLHLGCLKPVVRDVLSFDEAQVVTANRSAAGGAGANTEICGARAPFLEEISDNLAKNVLPKDAKVSYEWAPVVAGPDRRVPTINQRQFFVAGTLEYWERSDADIRFMHPFGQVDVTFDLAIDPAFKDLIYQPAPQYKYDPDATFRMLHLELDRGLFPHRAQSRICRGNPTDVAATEERDELWYAPWPPIYVDPARFEGPDARDQRDEAIRVEVTNRSDRQRDRVIALGSWIMDCGHPSEYHSEVHPPVFLAFAHVENGETVSHAFANPYSNTQLFNRSESLGAQLAKGDGRYVDAHTKAFPGHVEDELEKIALGGSTRLEAHQLIGPLQFDDFSWFVCAPPESRPRNPRLAWRSGFVKRTGIDVKAKEWPDLGCVQFMAHMDGSVYKPMALEQLRQNYEWRWEDVTADASKGEIESGKVHDVLKEVRTAAGVILASGILPIVPPDIQLVLDLVVQTMISNPPRIDCYELPAVQVHDESTPGDVEAADGQPFPFYGWARVAWKTGAAWPPPPQDGVPVAYIVPSSLDFTLEREQDVSVTNRGDASLVVSTVEVGGTNPADFVVGPDRCTGTALLPGQSCAIHVKESASGVGQRDGVLKIFDNASGSPHQVPMTGPGWVTMRTRW